MSNIKMCDCGEPTYSYKCSLCIADEGLFSKPQPKQEPVAWRWETHNGYAYSEQHYEGEDGQPLYTHPYVPTERQPKRERVVFPTMLRKMWSGGEVQAWLDENVNKEKNT